MQHEPESSRQQAAQVEGLRLDVVPGNPKSTRGGFMPGKDDCG